jgi:hypothetical protein
MPTLREADPLPELAELQAWYVDSLRPKLIRAVGSGAVKPIPAGELDRRVCELLGLRDDEKAPAA